MGSADSVTWLQKLSEQLNIDVDWMDPSYTLSLPIVPHDMTSNQGWVHEQMCNPINDELFKSVVKEYKDQGWLAIYTRMAVLMSKANIDNIQGRVLLQTLPSNAYDTEKTLEHARAYAREFESVGVSKDRFCIKIPSTGPALNACPILLQEGIRTLGTALFSVHQAIAASQAGCLYISPYYNGDREGAAFREERKVWSIEKFAGVFADEGNSALSLLKKRWRQVNWAVIRRQSPTRSSLSWLNFLMMELSRTDIDYLANGGAELDKANEEDPQTKKRLREALALFVAAEKRSQAKIEEAMKAV
ncbi:hypothetical protein N7468_003909 [Penicillium chermesinum]|uniref:Transaldolase n=1 Tax=Penicillium chermesinum TaxID=63820 RepID=A0A9W9TS21_9EURO|nr:uncharacterized protein N7468_003909 [Penicillium chermesinum]KAJ5239290.1 hypothetical protein N7468_003909 [Penicillium chermesinum]